MAVNETGQMQDILNAYDELKLPFTVTDSTMQNIADTSAISYPFFTQYVPDTIFNKPFGNDRKLTIHPIGKILVKNKETYLTTFVSSKTRSAIICRFLIIKNLQ